LQLDEEKLLAALADAADVAEPEVRRGFAPEQLVPCPTCLRRNAPTRMNCLYCGAALPAAVMAAGSAFDPRRPALLPVDEWESGFNVVVLPSPPTSSTGADGEVSGRLAAEGLAEAAALLKIEAGQLRELTEANELLPLARVSSAAEGELLEKRLTSLGLRVVIVADDDLAIDALPPRRVRQLEFEATDLVGWRHVEQAAESVEWSEIRLLVPGRIQRKRIEMDERSKRGSERELVSAREFYADENVLDIYFARSRQNWRIMAERFDYSCLSAEKSLLTVENFQRLTAVVRQRATAAVYHDAYPRVRHLLKFAWPPGEQSSTGGLRRDGRPGRVRSEAVLSVSNERQFTRYGCLLRQYLTKGTNAT